MPAGGATQWLPIMVGDRRAREILLMCERITAQQAAEWGLVNWAVPAGELDPKVDEVVEKLAALVRIADGLDRSHRQLVTDVGCSLLPGNTPPPC